jgi:hypothetical protein
MPTYEVLASFLRDYEKLTAEQQAAFLTAVSKLVNDLKQGELRAGLRVELVRGTDHIFELTWAPNGRATFQYGASRLPGEFHVIWRRIGTHDIFTAP